MTHQWHFFRSGGVDQVSLRDGADLAALRELDPKLWVALAMPVRDIDIDPDTLKLIDRDGDGRIRLPDLLATLDWVGKTWKDAGTVLRGSETLALAAIQDGPVLRATRQVLRDVGKPDAKEIAFADVAEVAKVFAETRFNGDGVVTPATAGDDDGARQVIVDAIATVGAVADRSGKDGLDQAKLDAFFTQLDEVAAWAALGDDAALRPAGDGTEAAADALAAVRAKVADYFARARLAAYDARAAASLDPQEATLTAIGGRTLASDDAEIASLPLARVEAGRALPLRGALNPAWTTPIATFVERAVTPLLGARDALTEADFTAVCDQLAGYEAWRAARPAHAADLALPRILALAAGDARKDVAALIALDLERADDYAELASVERLVRLQRDLGRVLRNFVNFADFYSKQDGVFQAGTLYLDGRAAALCVAVSDAAKHGALAGLSSAYLVYCDLVRGTEKRAIAAAFTNGDSDNLIVGRNGVFYDRKGDDWDATITKIVANPISVRQAFWSPYKKLVAAGRGADQQARPGGRCRRRRPRRRHRDQGRQRGSGRDRAAAAAAGQEDGRRHRRGDRRRGRRRRRADHRRDRHVLRPGRVDAGGPGGAAAADQRPLDVAGLDEAAPAQPRPDPRRQRLGHQRTRAHQRRVRRGADHPGDVAAGREALDRRSVRGQAPAVEALHHAHRPARAGRDLVRRSPRPVAAGGGAEHRGAGQARARRRQDPAVRGALSGGAAARRRASSSSPGGAYVSPPRGRAAIAGARRRISAASRTTAGSRPRWWCRRAGTSSASPPWSRTRRTWRAPRR